MGYVIGVDIGGTFTDCVALTPEGRLVHSKALSTHATDPGDGVVDGIALLAQALSRPIGDLLAQTERVSHGTTIGTNLVVERKGARTGLLTTAGHVDVMSMMRGGGRTAGLPFEQVFSVHASAKPEPLIPRERIGAVYERVDRTGAVIAPLDEARARSTIRALVEAEGIEALAICLLWSFRNPAHERRLAELAREIAPGLFVSLSSEVSPQLGEYERTVATVINAYIGPASARYLRNTSARLAGNGLCNPFLVMQANGGVIPISAAEQTPLATLDSGPAGGLVGATSLARACGHRNVIATDMGGTSFDVGLVVDARPVIAETCVLSQYTYRAPHLDVRSIACGGGSIAWVDPITRSLRVGPHSAGSSPGPVAYRRGGTAPTVTDADVVLGLVRADGFLDGRMPLDAEAARAAIARLGEEIGLGVEQTAAGILKVNNAAAANLIRQRTIQQGLDPRDFAIYAFGGAGPVHAFGFAQELGVSEVVVPLGNGASTLSAYGIAASDMLLFFDQACDFELPADAGALKAALGELEARALAAAKAQGLEPARLAIERIGFLRYRGQFFQSLALPLPDVESASFNATLRGRFNAEYARLYGEGALVMLQDVELFSLRVRVTLPLAAGPERLQRGGAAPKPSGSRRVFWPGPMDWRETAVWDGAALRPGDLVAGPAVVELRHTTVAVAPGQTLVPDKLGNHVLRLPAGDRA
jgi:N-methylhydantoinase A